MTASVDKVSRDNALQPGQTPEFRTLNEWSSADIDKAYRRIAGEDTTPLVRAAWLSNHTIEHVVRAASVCADAWDVPVVNTIGPYDQHFQALLDENSDVLAADPNVIVLWMSLRVMAPSLVEGGAGLTEAELRDEITRVCETIGNWVDLATKNSNAHLIVGNFIRPAALRFGIADTSSPSGEQFIYIELNRWLSSEFADHPRVTVADFSQAVATAGSESAWNPRMFRLAKIEWDGKAARSIAMLLGRTFRALVRPARKCIVLDLDNTLWGGILGEDGPAGVRMEEGDPTGESFLAFQRALKDIKARGILLAICSKNNSADVEELFETRTGIPLQKSDFSASRVNWESKDKNIVSIAQELNIGLDAIVFIDDNPAECELIRQVLPEVKTIQLPSDPSEYAELAINMPDFDKIKLTDEDKTKSEQYAANAARNAQKTTNTDLTAYLESLGTKLTIRTAESADLTRVHQLFSKTNQFNVTTIRYDVGEIQGFLDSEDYDLSIASVSDNFGDMGIVGLYLLRLDSGGVEIDSYVLSCRALGRGIETAICNQIKKTVFENHQCEQLKSRLVPTAKNKPAIDFFMQQGFEVTSSAEDGTIFYMLSKARSKQIPAPGISVTTEESQE